MNILLTGASGTIGTRLLEKILKSEYNVIGVDRKENKWNISLNSRTIKRDLLNPSTFEKLPKDIDLIIHFAANARVHELNKNPKLALENIITTFNILDFARKKKIKKIIFSSSREVYGNLLDEDSIKENYVKIGKSESPYAASKVSSEAFIHSYKKVYGIDFVIVRFSNVYGMYDNSNRVIPLWIKQALNDEDLILFGKDKVLDFTYVDDAVMGVIRVIKEFENVKGETFNIAYGKGVKLTYVARKIKKMLNSESRIVIKENRLGEVWKFEADISKAKMLLNYDPKIDINEGLLKTVQWYKNYYKLKI